MCKEESLWKLPGNKMHGCTSLFLLRFILIYIFIKLAAWTSQGHKGEGCIGSKFNILPGVKNTEPSSVSSSVAALAVEQPHCRIISTA